MARFAVGAAVLFALFCGGGADGLASRRRDDGRRRRQDDGGRRRSSNSGGHGTQPGEYGWDDKKHSNLYNPKAIPPHDTCPIDCNVLCSQGLGRSITGWRDMTSNSDCQNACYAHSIETPHPKQGFWDQNMQQGKYVQKVIAEYCDRGLCGHGSGLLQASAVQKHEQKEGEVYSPNAWKGDPRAVSSGWPSGCESEEYYCQEICQNMYHKPTSAIGEHFGADSVTWSSDQSLCIHDCKANSPGMFNYWDDWCTCYEGPGGDMHLENVPGLLQEGQELEAVDVGSFMQVPAGEL